MQECNDKRKIHFISFLFMKVTNISYMFIKEEKYKFSL